MVNFKIIIGLMLLGSIIFSACNISLTPEYPACVDDWNCSSGDVCIDENSSLHVCKDEIDTDIIHPDDGECDLVVCEAKEGCKYVNPGKDELGCPTCGELVCDGCIPNGGDGCSRDVDVGETHVSLGDDWCFENFDQSGEFNCVSCDSGFVWLPSSNNCVVEKVERKNSAPVVNAGSDFNVEVNNVRQLKGSVTDDGLPNNKLTTKWTKIVGPGEVKFLSPNLVDTDVIFKTAGTYVLQLTANDGEKSTSDEVTITATTATTEPSEKLKIISATQNAEYQEAANPIQNSYDNDLVTRWAARPIPSEITFDLGEVKQVGETKFLFYDNDQGRIYKYSIDASTDNTHWTPVVTEKNSNEGFTIDTFTPLSARYIRLNFVSQNQGDWAGLYEAEIWSSHEEINPLKETCTDGIKNQDETGIDCGGICPACGTGPELGSGTTYYVSTSGNDNNDGLSQNKPIKSLSKVNSLELKPGDNVLFKRGDKWQEENGVALLALTSGTESDRITYSNYGQGDLPIISLVTEVDGWKDPSKWTKYTGAKDKNGKVYPDVWVMKYPSKENTVQIARLWLNKGDGLYEPVYANWRDYEDKEGVAAYDNLDGTFFVNPTREFSYKKSTSQLFVYSPNNINPANYYTEMKYAGGIDAKEGNHPWDWSDNAVELRNADYVTIDGLDMRGGSFSTMGIAGSDYVIIRNNKIGEDGEFAALTVGTGKVAIKAKADSSNYGQIYNNIIDSKYPAPMYVTHSAFHIIVDCIILSKQYENVSYWDIHDNYIHDWGVGLLVVDAYKNGYYTQYHKFHDNTVEMEHESYTKPFQYSNEFNDDSLPPTYIQTYNNIFKGYNIHAQVASDGNIVYNNIFMNARDVLNSHDSGGDGIDEQSGARDNVYIGNTFYDTQDAVFRWMGGNAIIANNLFVDTSKKTNGLRQIYSNPAYSSYQNNLFNYPGLTKNDKVFLDLSDPNRKSLSVAEYEEASNGKSKGNFVFEGAKSELINSDLTIPSGSPAINAGIDVTEWVPEGFRDMNGNLVNREHPTLGALEYK